MAVGADGHTRLWGDDGTEPGVTVEHSCDVDESLLHGGIVDRRGVRMDHHLNRGRGVPAEMLLREFTDLDRFGSVGLPPSTRQ